MDANKSGCYSYLFLLIKKKYKKKSKQNTKQIKKGDIIQIRSKDGCSRNMCVVCSYDTEVQHPDSQTGSECLK